MNVYDFDGTIYDGDSSVDLYLFCIRNKPSVFWRCVVPQLWAAARYKLKFISKERFKEVYFRFVRYISMDEALLGEFWEENAGKIKPWYLKQKRPDDLIISASPAFLLRPVCDKLGVSLIASRIDPATGLFEGENCRGEEKVRRFREAFPDGVIDEFYTDSKADLPLARIARKAFAVDGEKVVEMNEVYPLNEEKNGK